MTTISFTILFIDLIQYVPEKQEQQSDFDYCVIFCSSTKISQNDVITMIFIFDA